MKQIDTLVPDILELVSSKSGSLESFLLSSLGQSVSSAVEKRLVVPEMGTEILPTLRASQLGTLCERKLWYTLNRAEAATSLPPEAEIKFLFGDILEALLLALAEAAGHTVEGQQTELSLYGIIGHRDAIIDGVVVDCKSASSLSYDKFEQHLTPEQDSFGYLTQLQFYMEASKDDPLVRNHNVGAFLVIDKQLGRICLDRHKKADIDWESFIDRKREAIDNPHPPARAFHPIPDGRSGNLKLGVECSYCPFKQTCWPNLRTFLYANGPRFLTHVERLPDVPEV